MNIQIDQIGLSDTINEMIKNDDILGCQVCVIKNKKVITNIAAGVLDPYERVPTKFNSIFNSFSVTKGSNKFYYYHYYHHYYIINIIIIILFLSLLLSLLLLLLLLL